MTTPTPTLYRAEFTGPDSPPLILELHPLAAVNPATGIPFHGVTATTAEEAGRAVAEILKPRRTAPRGWTAVAIPERKPPAMVERRALVNRENAV